MDCNESHNLMSAYLDDELDPSIRARYQEHLANCTACNAAYENLVRLRATLKSNAKIYTAPSHLHHRVLSDLNANKAQRREKSKRMPWAWINFGVATACTFAFAVMLSLYLAVPSEADRINQEIVASHYRSLLANHLADVASSDQHTVKPWFSGKLDYSPPVIDLAQQGFPLVGGRLDYLDRRSVAALAYRHGPHLVNLFVWPDKDNRERPARMTLIQGFNLLQWEHSGMIYKAISDMNQQELAAFHKLLLVQSENESK